MEDQAMKINNSPGTSKQLSLLDKARQQAKDRPNFWKPTEPNDGIEGHIVKMTSGGRYGSTFFHVRTDTEVLIVAASPATVLGQKLAELELSVGDRLAVLFLGESVSKSGSTFKNWTVVSEPADKPKSAIGIFESKD